MYSGPPIRPNHVWDHVKSNTRAGNRDEGKSREGCALTPTKPNLLRTYSGKYQLRRGMLREMLTFVFMPISVHTALAGAFFNYFVPLSVRTSDVYFSCAGYK